MGAITREIQRIRGKAVYLDTNPVIYFLNRDKTFFEIILPIFKSIEAEEFSAYSGELCLAELLVKPLRENEIVQARNINELFDSGFITLLSHDREVFELAAQIRASRGLKMIDAVHVATAIKNGCEYIISGDKGIAGRLDGVEVINLSSFVS